MYRACGLVDNPEGLLPGFGTSVGTVFILF